MNKLLILLFTIFTSAKSRSETTSPSNIIKENIGYLFNLLASINWYLQKKLIVTNKRLA